MSVQRTKGKRNLSVQKKGNQDYKKLIENFIKKDFPKCQIYNHTRNELQFLCVDEQCQDNQFDLLCSSCLAQNHHNSANGSHNVIQLRDSLIGLAYQTSSLSQKKHDNNQNQQFVSNKNQNLQIDDNLVQECQIIMENLNDLKNQIDSYLQQLSFIINQQSEQSKPLQQVNKMLVKIENNIPNSQNLKSLVKQLSNFVYYQQGALQIKEYSDINMYGVENNFLLNLKLTYQKLKNFREFRNLEGRKTKIYDFQKNLGDSLGLLSNNVISSSMTKTKMRNETFNYRDHIIKQRYDIKEKQKTEQNEKFITDFDRFRKPVEIYLTEKDCQFSTMPINRTHGIKRDYLYKKDMMAKPFTLKKNSSGKFNKYNLQNRRKSNSVEQLAQYPYKYFSKGDNDPFFNNNQSFTFDQNYNLKKINLFSNRHVLDNKNGGISLKRDSSLKKNLRLSSNRSIDALNKSEIVQKRYLTPPPKIKIIKHFNKNVILSPINDKNVLSSIVVKSQLSPINDKNLKLSKDLSRASNNNNKTRSAIKQNNKQ